MLSLSTVQILIGLLAAKAAAQASPVKLCTSEICDNCPNAVLSTEPTDDSTLPCVVYDRETVLGGAADQYPPIISGHRNIWYDVTPDGECKYAIRTPADPGHPKCGSTSTVPAEAKCVPVLTQSSFAVQKCCGNTQCEKISGRLGGRQDTSGYTNVALRNAEGDLIVPVSVGGGPAAMDKFLEAHGLNSSEVITERSSSGHMVFKKRSVPEVALTKRDCVFNKNGESYSSSSLESTTISRRLCYNTNPTFSDSTATTVGWSTTFSAGINIEVFSAGVDFTIEESATTTLTYTLSVPKDQCGHFAFTAFTICQAGSVAGCDGGDADGEVCTAKRLDNGQIDGDYTFVIT